MKQNENLEALSLEELHKKLKTIKTITGLLAGLLIVEFAVGIYLTTQQGFNVFTVIPIAFVPIVVANSISIKKLNEEIAKRK